MTVNINNQEIELRVGFRAFLLYEAMTDKSFAGGGLSESLFFFYAVVFSSDKSKSISWEVFLDWLDENPDELEKFNDFLIAYNERNAGVSKSSEKELSEEEIETVKKN